MADVTKSETYTTEVYYDTQDPENAGWAYRCDEHGSTHGESGGLGEGDEDETLTHDEARALAAEAIVHDDGATHVRVYWHGERDPITFSREDLEP